MFLSAHTKGHRKRRRTKGVRPGSTGASEWNLWETDAFNLHRAHQSTNANAKGEMQQLVSFSVRYLMRTNERPNQPNDTIYIQQRILFSSSSQKLDQRRVRLQKTAVGGKEEKRTEQIQQTLTTRHRRTKPFAAIS